MAASVLLSRIMGLVRDKVISYYYGATLESDVYFASFVIPDFINYLLAGGYFSITLIPLLSERFEKNEDDGWRFFSAVTLWVFSAAAALTGVAWLAAPHLAHIAAPGFEPEATARLARFLRIVLPAQVFFLVGSCFTALLYMRRQFIVPALTPLVYNGCIIAMGLLFRNHGMEGFCWGVLVGSLLGNCLLPVLAAHQGGGVRLIACWAHSGLKRFVWLALPLMLGQSVVVLDEQLIRVFGSLAQEGAVSWLNYARRLMLVPVGVVAQAAGVASYPFLAAMAAKKETAEFNATLSASLRNTLVFLTPASVWLIVAAEPAVRLVFQQGKFGSTDGLATSLCLQVMLAGLFCWGVQQLVGRAFYARQDTLTPSLAGTGASIVSIPVYWLLGKWLGALGVAAASAMAVSLYTLALCLLWRRRYGPAGLEGVFSALGAAAALSLAAAVPAAATVRLPSLFLSENTVWEALASLLLSWAVFCITFAVLGAKFARPLVEPVLDRLLGKYWRAQHD